MRRWGEGAARWSLTLLLVALVGVTVASGWWRLRGWLVVPTFHSDRQTLGIFGDLRRGTLELDWATSRKTQGLACRVRAWPDPAWEGPSCLDVPPPKTFNLWRAQHHGSYCYVAMTYPTLAVALPTLFLWYSRIRRRYRRGLCARCGYDLAGLTAVEERVVCPECGTGVAAARVIERELPRAAPAEGQAASPGARSAEPE